MASIEQNDLPQYYNGYKYLFAYYCLESKIWYVQPRRFILMTCNNQTLHGQFLQSTWFNIIYKKNQTPIFVVLKVHKTVSCSTIEKDMNSLKNPFPTVYDIPPYIKSHSYFNMSWHLTNKCIDEVKKLEDMRFTLRAVNNPWNTLEMNIYYNHETDDVTFTLPYFVSKHI